MAVQVQSEKMKNRVTGVDHFHTSIGGNPMNYIAVSTHVENAENGDICIYRHTDGTFAVSVNASKGTGEDREASDTCIWFTETQLGVLTSLLTGRKLNAGARVSRPLPKK